MFFSKSRLPSDKRRIFFDLIIIVTLFLNQRAASAQSIAEAGIPVEQKANPSTGQPDIVVINFPVQGWYLVSLSVTVADSSVSTLFPTALGVFAWDNANNRYVRATTLQIGRGYWVLMASPTAVVISGMRFSQFRRHYLPGWHLIGSLIDSVNFSNPNDTPDRSVILPIFAWNAGEQRYYSTTTIEQSYGQWMAVLQECDVTFKPGSTMVAAQKSDQFSQQAFYQRFGAAPPPPFPASQSAESALPVSSTPTQQEPHPTPERLHHPRETAGKIALQINTVPIHCNVIVDDKMVGQSPLTVYIDRFSNHVIQISAAGYEEKTKLLDYHIFGTETIYLFLEKLDLKK